MPEGSWSLREAPSTASCLVVLIFNTVTFCSLQFHNIEYRIIYFRWWRSSGTLTQRVQGVENFRLQCSRKTEGARNGRSNWGTIVEAQKTIFTTKYFKCAIQNMFSLLNLVQFLKILGFLKIIIIRYYKINFWLAAWVWLSRGWAEILGSDSKVLSRHSGLLLQLRLRNSWRQWSSGLDFWS